MPAVLEVRDLTKVFHRGSLLARDRIVAVDNVSFQMNRGGIFTLAGEERLWEDDPGPHDSRL